MSAFFDPVNVIAPVGHSYHNSASKGNQFSKKRVSCGKRDFNQAFFEWLAKLNWLELYQTEQCKAKLVVFQNVILSGFDCLLAERTVKMHINDKP